MENNGCRRMNRIGNNAQNDSCFRKNVLRCRLGAGCILKFICADIDPAMDNSRTTGKIKRKKALIPE
jgi:hypothetical protein